MDVVFEELWVEGLFWFLFSGNWVRGKRFMFFWVEVGCDVIFDILCSDGGIVDVILVY